MSREQAVGKPVDCRADIDLTKIPEGALRELIRRCLDCNLKNRLQHKGEARIAIDNYGTQPAVILGTAKRNYWHCHRHVRVGGFGGFPLFQHVASQSSGEWQSGFGASAEDRDRLCYLRPGR